MAKKAPQHVRARREALGLSQVALAERARLSRQSIGAIESGRSLPAVDVALRLARALECRVEDLFGEPASPAHIEAEAEGSHASGRTALARVADRWIAYRLDEDGVRMAADGLAAGAASGAARVSVEPLRSTAELLDNVVMLGCAAGLGLLADRLNSRAGPGRFLWFSRSSVASLQALADRRAHLAGVHLVDARTGEANVADVRRLAGAQPLVLVTLARWEAGLVARAGDASPLQRAADLARPGLRLVGREAGAGAQRLLERTARAQGLTAAATRHPHLKVSSHLDVARAVAMGAADTGVATRDAALAFGLRFIPLAEERYDLALPRAALNDARLVRLLDVLVSGALRRELEALGYDTRPTGQRAAEIGAA